MPDNFDQLILDNQPFPETDIDSLPFGPFQAPENSRLASYLEISGALGAFPGAERVPLDDLVPAAGPDSRFTILTTETTIASAAPGTVPLVAGLKASWRTDTSRTVRSAVIAAVPRQAGARDQLEPVFANLPAPALIDGPDCLPANVALLYSVDGSLQAAADTRLGFIFNWLREIAAGALAADLGLALDAGVEAALDVSLAGSFLAAINRDREGRLRLRIFRRRDSALDFALNVAVTATPRGVLPDRPEQLALAILGVHEGQWLDALARLAKADPEKLRARFGEAVDRFLDLWRNLEPRAAAAIWRAAEKSDDLAAVRRWVHRIATELRTPEDFKAVLGEVLEASPGFAASPAGIWLEAAAGGLLAAVVDQNRFQQLVRAAGAADALLSDETLAGVLTALKHYAAEQLGLGRIERALDSLASCESLDAWVLERLTAIFGNLESEEGLGRAARNLKAVIELARKIYSRALEALEAKYAAEIGYHYEQSGAGDALLDCSFSFTPEGLAAYRAAFAGDFSFLSKPPEEHVRLHRAVLSHTFNRNTHLELHLPFLDRKQWEERWEALARVEVQTGEDGRLFAYTVDASDSIEKKSSYQGTLALVGALLTGREPDFTLTYTGRRAGVRVQELAPLLNAYGFPENAVEEGADVSLTLSVPGSFVAAWLHAPDESSSEYFPTFSAVSVAVQRALRQWLPYLYFSDIDRYGDLEAAFPLIVYKCMRPYPGRGRGEFTYDVMEPQTMPLALRSAARALPAETRRIHALLTAAGKPKIAKFYAPDETRQIIAAVQRKPHLLNGLLSADAFFVDNLQRLAKEGRALREALPANPKRAVKKLAKFAAEFVATFHRRLRRLYGGQNFTQFGSLLLVEATRALHGALNGEGTVAGVLRVSKGEKGAAGAYDRIVVNSAFRP
ncbi:MAG TPA: hypothetical protein PLA43_10550 [Bryobacteraceae bacterium]|nr:hypothetical protein [Bryobacteraceae bacterium]HOQ46718.1 hypothetical protein [Bryobacteraceae bacterium]HPU72388.1 hypothetical protein [Bryobacteraceae bacterium]